MSEEHLPSKRVIACNFLIGTKACSEGTLAYITRPKYPHVELLTRARSKRWIVKWEPLSHLHNFRMKTIPPESPLYSNEHFYDGYMEATAHHLSVEAKYLRRSADGLGGAWPDHILDALELGDRLSPEFDWFFDPGQEYLLYLSSDYDSLTRRLNRQPDGTWMRVE